MENSRPGADAFLGDILYTRSIYPFWDKVHMYSCTLLCFLPFDTPSKSPLMSYIVMNIEC
jgi:hypothetical protein